MPTGIGPIEVIQGERQGGRPTTRCRAQITENKGKKYNKAAFRLILVNMSAKGAHKQKLKFHNIRCKHLTLQRLNAIIGILTDHTVNASNSPSSGEAAALQPPPSGAQPISSSREVPPPIAWPPTPPEPCTRSTCPNGHVWIPIVQLVPCPACRAPLVAMKMINCPVCNEPTRNLRLRVDHLAPQGGIAPACIGGHSFAEIAFLEHMHTHAAHEQAHHVEREMPQKL